MKARPQQRMAKRRDRFVVGYLGSGNGLFGKNTKPAGEPSDMIDPMSRAKAERILKEMPCADCAIFELIPVKVNR